MVGVAQAVSYLLPGCDFVNTDDTLAGIQLLTPGFTLPTQGQVDAAIVLLTCWETRAAAYPQMKLFANTAVWLAACDAVNTANPLPDPIPQPQTQQTLMADRIHQRRM